MAKKKAKAVKGKKAPAKAKRESKKLPKAQRMVEIVAGTLEANSEGEFDLPSMLTQYLSGPKARLGLHREFYLPVTQKARYYPSGTKVAFELYHRQAAQVMVEILGSGFPVSLHEYDLPLCKECE